MFTATIMATPFQWLLNCHHHSLSDLADTFSCTRLSSLLTVVDRSISLLRKDRPALLTYRHDSARLVGPGLHPPPRAQCGPQFCQLSACSGNLTSCFTESNSKPRNEIVVAGPPPYPLPVAFLPQRTPP